jgi:hypothetical protein
MRPFLRSHRPPSFLILFALIVPGAAGRITRPLRGAGGTSAAALAAEFDRWLARSELD